MAKTNNQIAVNKKKIAEMLGPDPQLWSRECVLPYPKKFEESIDLLYQAAQSAIRGEDGISKARQLLAQTGDHEMREWFDSFAQNAGQVRAELLGITKSRKGASTAKRPSKKEELEVIESQGFHCQYCGIRLVHNDQFLKLQKIVGYTALPNRSALRGKMKNLDIHGLWVLTRATVDHIDPMSNGSEDPNRRENLVACCWPCNYAKFNFTLDELRLDHPRTRDHKVSQWKGLTDLLG